MEDWKNFISKKLLPELKGDLFWEKRLKSLEKEICPNGIHLAIFNEPYLSYILEGKKTIESRFSKNKIAPYKNVYTNDIVLLKLSGGPIIGICLISDIWHYLLVPESWKEMKKEYTISLCAQDPNFWQQRKSASYATLMRMKHIEHIKPIEFSKKDRRGWVVLKEKSDPNKSLNIKSTIIALSGKIGCGKTTLSNALSSKLSCPSVSFGHYIRKEAKRRGLEQTRDSLQQLGGELLKDPNKLCLDVLSSISWSSNQNIIVDGVRHKCILEELHKLKPKSKILLVYIDVKENIRLDRLKKRNSSDYIELIKIESHITEIDVKEILKNRADIVVDGELPVTDLIQKIISMLEV